MTRAEFTRTSVTDPNVTLQSNSIPIQFFSSARLKKFHFKNSNHVKGNRFVVKATADISVVAMGYIVLIDNVNVFTMEPSAERFDSNSK